MAVLARPGIDANTFLVGGFRAEIVSGHVRALPAYRLGAQLRHLLQRARALFGRLLRRMQSAHLDQPSAARKGERVPVDVRKRLQLFGDGSSSLVRTY